MSCAYRNHSLWHGAGRSTLGHPHRGSRISWRPPSRALLPPCVPPGLRKPRPIPGSPSAWPQRQS
ncbi:MAG TPA: hypothetical protein DCW62_12315, partial [Pseudomonas sp.]|nr:hypothetical protein [Pseudomonas sp.]